MHGSSALQPGAGRAASGAARRRPTPSSPIAELERLQSRFDQLLFDTKLGARSHREFERMVGEAESIATGIRAAFRGSAPQDNPPLEHTGGRAWW